MRSHLRLEARQRRVEPEANEVPAADLDRSELRMLEGVPVDVPLTELVRELQHRELVLGRVLPQPVDEVVVGQPGCALRAPELGHPGVYAQVVVDPVDVAALDDGLRVVLEVVEDGDRRVPRESRGRLAHADDGSIEIADPYDTLDKPCYDIAGLTRRYEHLTTVSRYCNELGWGNYANDHEDANGQFEQNFEFADALTTADRAIFFRYMVHTLAEQGGMIATFMEGERSGDPHAQELPACSLATVARTSYLGGRPRPGRMGAMAS